MPSTTYTGLRLCFVTSRYLHIDKDLEVTGYLPQKQAFAQRWTLSLVEKHKQVSHPSLLHICHGLQLVADADSLRFLGHLMGALYSLDDCDLLSDLRSWEKDVCKHGLLRLQLMCRSSPSSWRTSTTEPASCTDALPQV